MKSYPPFIWQTLIVLTIFFSVSNFAYAQETGYILIGQKSYWENSYAHINISQHRLTTTEDINSIEYFAPLINFTWKTIPSTIDIVFVFDEAIRGGIDTGQYNVLPNGTKTITWTDRTGLIEHQERNNRHYYIISGFSVTTNQLIMARLRIEADSIQKGKDIKYDLLMKLTSDTIIEALEQKRYVALDPILYTNNLASGIVSCQANSTHSTNYKCTKIYNLAINAQTDCWLSLDNAYSSEIIFEFNNSYNIGYINITQGELGSYHSGFSKIFRSDDNASWAEVDSVNMENGDRLNYTLKNLAGYGSGKYWRIVIYNSTASDANKANGICEMSFYQFGTQDLAPPSFFNYSLNISKSYMEKGDDVQVRIHVRDDNITRTLLFAENSSGSFNNITVKQDISLEYYSANFNFTNLQEGQIKMLWWANDTPNNKNTSGYYYLNITGKPLSGLNCYASGQQEMLFLKDKNTLLCLLNNTNYTGETLKCQLKVYSANKLIQVQPEIKKIPVYGEVSYFESQQRNQSSNKTSLINLYFTNENLRPDIPYDINITCFSGDKKYSDKITITPQFYNLKQRVATLAIDAQQKIPQWTIIIILIVFVTGLGYSLWKKII